MKGGVESPPAPSNEDRWSPRDFLVAWLHLAVLWAFGVAKPLLDVLADSPEFFVARGNTSGDIVLLAVVLLVVPPTAFVVLELVVVVSKLRRLLHALFVAVLLGLLALQLLVDVADRSGKVLLPLAAVLGVVGAVLYVRTRLVPTTLTVLGPAPLAFLVLFLVFSPVSDLVFPEEVEVQAAGATAGAGDAPVVWVTFDEFSAATLMNSKGGLDAARYPNFAALAQDSTWYPNATTVDGATTVAVPALMTGTYPDPEELPTAADHPGSIFTLLGGRYDLDVTEAATAVCPEDLCGKSALDEAAGERARALVEDLGIVSGHILLPKDMRERLPAVDRTFGGFADTGADSPAAGGGPPQAAKDIPATATARRGPLFNRFIKRIGSGRTRSLHFLHTALPHVPWRFLPSGQQYPVSGPDIPGLSEEQWADDGYLTEQAMQRYLLQVGFVDRLIGRLVRRLKATGLYNKAIVVITADHGVAFQPGLSRRGMSPENLGEIASVPLFIKLPGQRDGQVDTGLARTTDIVPTIAGALGLDPSWEVDGRSLAGNAAPQKRSLPFGVGRSPISYLTFLSTRDQFVERMRGLFGEGTGSVFGFGRDNWLVGTRVSDLQPSATSGEARAFLGPDSDSKFELDTPGLYSSVQPGGALLPTFVTGRVTADAGRRFAIAVNGRVWATGRTYEAFGEVRAGAMVPPEALSRGRNRVELLLLDEVGRRTQVSKVEGEGRESAGARLITQGGATEIVFPSGDRVPVESGAVRGYVDSAVAETNSLTIGGWALDATRKEPVQAVLVFANGKLIADGPPEIERSDLADQYGKGAARAGFRLVAATNDAEALADPNSLRVLGVSRGRASELEVAGEASFG